MTLRESKGNMYEWVTHTWNAIKGKCPHDCKYCYMKIFKQKAMRLDMRALEENLGSDNLIFVGSSIDVFAKDVPLQWIFKVLGHCVKYHKNKYLFQSKNPKRVYELRDYIPEGSIVATTIETNRFYGYIMGKCPSLTERAHYMNKLADVRDFKTIVTIEPIIDFDLDKLVELIKECKPTWVNIGADSKGHRLIEPSKAKILDLVLELEKFTEIKKKTNLARLTK